MSPRAAVRDPARTGVVTSPDRLTELLSADPDPALHGRPIGAAQAAEEASSQGRHRRGQVPVFTVPESLRSVDLRVGSRAVRGMLVIAVVVIAVLLGRWWWTSNAATAEPGDRIAVSPTGSAAAVESAEEKNEDGTGPAGLRAFPSAPTGQDDAVASPAVPATVLVHVAGQVRAPGVVEVKNGSRVIDAILAAKGFTKDADQASLNLARTVVDGEQVWVGKPGEEPPDSARAVVPGDSSAAGPAMGADGKAGGTGTSGAMLVNLNTATQAELEELPGIGPVTAERMIAWRQEHGKFSIVEELLEVSGIGERTFAQLQPLVTVGQ
ncbi:MAG: helix-hairpin-helix domain-containing protein [Ornithinimicrobium sp.]|uniref:helix-hairpin-helix domain-containing protein n=1 Tax=Ornithinimicrobium sp. TaxID=1977084 RepID=UPI0026DED4D4|nr:helix-hairpin-helix domain-containing protein [Ornithinimicrobium sp.]MDO5741144.1 helix-hairpin-helix domain-containing protein [Ornithinimicrobium sp.]